MVLQIKEKAFIYLNALLFVATLNSMFDIVHYNMIFNYVSVVIYAAIFVLTSRKLIQKLKDNVYKASREYKDDIKKRTGNCIYLTVYLLAIFFMNIYISAADSPKKIGEIFTAIRPSYSWTLFGCFLLYVSAVILSAICSKEELQQCRKYYQYQSMICMAFWILYFCVCLLVGIRFIYISFFIVSILYFIATVLCNLIIRKK